jgi:TolB-like protein/tetratricopeptide (TPR) repeat protein
MASVWGELKRRNVVRVAIAYAVVSWLVLQLTDVLNQLLGLPEWTGKLVLLLIVAGFPMAVFFAWAYEVTPEGLKKEKDIDRSKSITHSTGRKLDRVIIGILAIAVTYFLAEKFILPGEVVPETRTETSVAAPQEVEKSIAVLPFVNMSADPEQEYFSDGIAEEILNGLVKVPDLRVVARTSAFSFKGQNIDIREVGETLNANHVLEGSVRKAGDRLRITAQLISVHDGYHLWSETYDRKIDDIFAIQDEIARAVVAALEVTLGLGEEAPLVNLGTTNTDAYNWFLRGNFYIGQQTPEAFDKAIESYQKSIDADPEFAGGYGGLAYGLAYNAVFYPYLEVAERVRETYTRALEINENQTHALLAYAVDAALARYDFVAAERTIRKALESGVHQTLVIDAYWWIVLAGQRRFDDALKLLTIAERADPLASVVHQGIGFNYAWLGDFERALPSLNAALELNPNDLFAAFMLVQAYIELNRLDEAESAAAQVEGIIGEGSWSLNAHALLNYARGDEHGARQIVSRMIEMHENGNTEPTLAPLIGHAFMHFGEIEEAMDWFERATDTPNPFHNFATLFFASRTTLRNHPRFQALMEKINLDDASVAAAKAAVAGQ